ncbi:hypothetical protein JW968_01250 [Candidatus Woesearchaeota archaeon]|nr:hypothetical protein [Candidatus Woesearchaeota archaeon]
MRSNKAQIITLDFMIALFIFAIVLLLFFRYYSMVSEKSLVFRELEIDADSISRSLLTKGYPEGWTQDNFTIIGITDGDMRINRAKLDSFTGMDYSQARSSFRTSYDFYFFLEDAEGARSYAFGVEPDGKNVVKTTRYVIFDGKVMNMVLYLWD